MAAHPSSVGPAHRRPDPRRHLVRVLLVPAVMRLVGHANWWAPAPLRRFDSRHGIREEDGPEPDAAAPEVLAPAGAR